jgi:hypothetical protein
MGEEIPAGVLTETATLQAPPEPIPATLLLPANLPEAWQNGVASALSIAVALSQKRGKTLPWGSVRQAIDGALRARLLEPAITSAPWPCDYAGAGKIALQVPAVQPPKAGEQQAPKAGVRIAQSELRLDEVQDFADAMSDITKAAAGHDLRVSVQMELGGEKIPPQDVVDLVNEVLAKKVSAKLRLE